MKQGMCGVTRGTWYGVADDEVSRACGLGPEDFSLTHEGVLAGFWSSLGQYRSCGKTVTPVKGHGLPQPSPAYLAALL